MFSFFHVYFIFHRFVLLIHLSFFVANSEINYSTLKSLRGLFFFFRMGSLFSETFNVRKYSNILSMCVKFFLSSFRVFLYSLYFFLYIGGFVSDFMGCWL